MRRLVTSAAFALLLPLAACTGSDIEPGITTAGDSRDDGAAAPAPTAPCDVTTAAVVADVFGGPVVSAKQGTSRNCAYTMGSGAAAEVVEVYYYGSSDLWKGMRANYSLNRGPLTPVDDVGESAFSPGDLGPNEVVVRQGATIFAVGLGGVPTATPVPQVVTLARRIAENLS